MRSVGVAEVLLFFQGEHAPGVTRTPDLRIRQFFVIPADDVRTKSARDAVPAVNGLLDEKGSIKPETKIKQLH
jgi:hypothetical protein